MNISEDGVEILSAFVSTAEVEAIKRESAEIQPDVQQSGIRNAEKKIPAIDEIAHSTRFIALASQLLGSDARLVRAILFDKTPEKNWLVSWHQDITVALNDKQNIPGWGPWSVKDGIHHVQPPKAVLDQMLTFRLHLDAADRNNACLKVIPGSHQLGVLSQQKLLETTNTRKPVLCEVEQGDLVLMRPLIIHASSKSRLPLHRRVVHLEYSNYPLPEGLRWVS